MLGTIVLCVIGVLAAALSIGWIYGEQGRLIRKSTWDMMKMQGFKNMLNFKATHAYLYGRWATQYVSMLRILIPRMGTAGKKRLTDGYHAKVMTHDQAKAIITLNKSIPLRDLEQVIPYPTARNLVLNAPTDVAVFNCPCRSGLKNHCGPLQVCMMIGKPITDFILEHYPGTSRRLSQTEALELLEQEHERGHMHTAWFKDVMLNRFYGLCSCCKCCCGGTAAMVKFGAQMLSSSGYVSVVDASKCDGCGACEKACHFNAIAVDKTASVAWDKCMGCGVCEVKCPNKAMSLVRDEKKGLPFDVRLMV
jgi:ferredoxin